MSQKPAIGLWYCCICDFGPHDHEIYASCIECQHPWDLKCTTVHPKNKSAHASSQSCERLCRGRQNVSTVRLSVLRSKSFRLSKFGRGSFPRRIIPLIDAKTPLSASSTFPSNQRRWCEDFQASYFLEGPTFPTHNRCFGTRLGDEEKKWFCCKCKMGPMLVATTPGCVSCNHPKCAECKEEEW